MERPRASDLRPQIPFDANDKELRSTPKLFNSKIDDWIWTAELKARSPLSSEIFRVPLGE